jgi:hypothetical protein
VPKSSEVREVVKARGLHRTFDETDPTKLSDEDLTKHERVELIIERLRAENPGIFLNHAEAAKWYAHKRYMRDDLQEELRDANDELEAAVRVLVMQFEADGVDGMKLATGDAVRVEDKLQTRVVDHQRVVAWAYENGLENKVQLPWPTVNALNGERLTKGGQEIPGTEVEWRGKVVFTKAK